MSDNMNKVSCQCLFPATVSSIVRRSTLAERKEICLFLAGVPGSGHTDSIKLQIWNIFESLSCFSVIQSDVLICMLKEQNATVRRKELNVKECQINTSSYFLFLSQLFPTAPHLHFNLKSAEI